MAEIRAGASRWEAAREIISIILLIIAGAILLTRRDETSDLKASLARSEHWRQCVQEVWKQGKRDGRGWPDLGLCNGV